MSANRKLKRVNVYVDPDALEEVARELGCRPSDAVRCLIENFRLAKDLDAIRKMPGGAPERVFRTADRQKLPPIPDDVEIEPVE